MERARLLSSALIAAALAAGLHVSAAQAQTFEGEGAKGLLQGLGIVDNDDEEKPDMRERGPLVLPSSGQLPAPLPPGSRSASNRPDWPTDPDEARRAEQKVIDAWKEQGDRGGGLKPNEMRGNTTAAKPGSKSDAPMGALDRSRVTMSPNELSGGHKLISKDTSWAESEPERRTLTEPPTGYRKPSTGAAYAPAPGKAGGLSGFLDKINPWANQD